jgi:hypothetical protein
MNATHFGYGLPYRDNRGLTGLRAHQIARGLAAGGLLAGGLALITFAVSINELCFGGALGLLGTVAIRLLGIAVFALAVAIWPALGQRRRPFGLLAYGVLATLYLSTFMATVMIGTGQWPDAIMLALAVVHAAGTGALLWSWLRQRQGDARRH